MAKATLLFSVRTLTKENNIILSAPTPTQPPTTQPTTTPNKFFTVNPWEDFLKLKVVV